MAAISVNDLARKLNNLLKRHPEIDKDGMIRDAWVCGRGDRSYPEGTIVFEVVDRNATEADLHKTTHELSIYPDRISRLN